MIERDTELQITSEPAIAYSTCYTLADCTDKTTNEAQKIKNAKRGVFLIDVVEGLKQIPNESQDLIIVDPPYYKAINENWDKQWKTERIYLDWCKLWFNECVRVLKDTGSFYCYGNFDILSKQKVLIFDNHLNFRQNITLDKGIKSIAGRTSDKLQMFPTASEYLLFYNKQSTNGNHKTGEYLRTEWKKCKEKGITDKSLRANMGLSIKGGGLLCHFWGFAQWQMPTKEHYLKLQSITGQFQVDYEDVAFKFNLPIKTTDIWGFTPDKIRFGHPTQKPQDICQRIIKASSNENDNVLIPFAGSGSECVASEILNRNWISFENEPKNIDITMNRIRELKHQLF